MIGRKRVRMTRGAVVECVVGRDDVAGSSWVGGGSPRSQEPGEGVLATNSVLLAWNKAIAAKVKSMVREQNNWWWLTISNLNLGNNKSPLIPISQTSTGFFDIS